MKNSDKHPPEKSGPNKTVTIIVNARPKEVSEKKLSFDEIVSLAYGTPNYNTAAFTVTFQRGNGQKPKGSLVKGEEIRVKEGMIFDVIRTDKS